MAVLFDSGELPTCQADDALTALFAHSGLPINVSHVAPSVGPTIVEQWSFAAQSLFIARADALRLTRSDADVKTCAPEGIRLGYQLSGSYRLTVGEYQEAGSSGHLNVTDLTQPCEFTQYSPKAAVASLEISWSDLGLKAESIRRATPLLHHSPVYPLIQAHMARLCADPTALDRPDVEPHIGLATLHLAQALIASADITVPCARVAFNNALYARVVEYTLLHLSEPSLTPERIAAAHNLSLRHLYRVWSQNQVGIAEWIIGERLARAAAALMDNRQQRRPISAIAGSLGFRDAAHFSRRFRHTYGVAPRDWRQQSRRPADSSDPTQRPLPEDMEKLFDR
jgi:AraC-like DNA-binding protein